MAAECLLQSPDGLLPSILQQAEPVICQRNSCWPQRGKLVAPPQAKKQTTLIQYTPAELQDLTKQVRQRAWEMVLGWLLWLWDDEVKGTELSLEEMAQLVSVMVIRSLRQRLQYVARLVPGAGNHSLINWLMSVAWTV